MQFRHHDNKYEILYRDIILRDIDNYEIFKYCKIFKDLFICISKSNDDFKNLYFL